MEKRIVIFYKLIFILSFIFVSLLLYFGFHPGYTITHNPQTKLPPKLPNISLKSIFEKPNNTKNFNKNKLVTLLATGDVIPARGANWPAVTSGDFTYNWKATASLLADGDITLINLEAPLTKNCKLMTEGMTFCGDTRHIKGLVFAGVDTVSIANNHIDNFGLAGRNETTALLESNNIGWSGFGKLDIRLVKNIKFGFLAFNGIEIPFDRDQIKKEIEEAKKKTDVLLVSAHWGDEYVLTPRKYGNIAPDDPQEIGHLMIDAGADLVIGNHPHTVQGVEIYKGKLITYAHGNFIFDQTWSQETQEGVVGEYTFYLSSEASAKEDEVHLVNVKFHPIIVNTSYQPRPLSEKEGQHILNRMLESSNLIKSQ